MHLQLEPEARPAVAPSAPRVRPVRRRPARPRMMSWLASSLLHVAVAVLLAWPF